jgi:hypothetical protein
MSIAETTIQIAGTGAVSPAGWGVEQLVTAIAQETPIALAEHSRPGWDRPLPVRRVPKPEARPSFATHARLRRTSPISQYAVASALEALGPDAERASQADFRLGIILCAMSGCVNYSRRFYDETLRDPATASPLVFPETVFNAPASHIAALLGTTAINYTLVGDPTTFLQGIALAADWLLDQHVDGCLVLGAEENDWLTADAFHLFYRDMVLSDGAGALYLKRAQAGPDNITVEAVTNPHLFTATCPRDQAAMQMQLELTATGPADLLCDGLQNVPRIDAAEAAAWKNWSGIRLSPKQILGEGLAAAPAWQTVLAIEELKQRRSASAFISAVGCNQQAIGARFGRKAGQASCLPGERASASSTSSSPTGQAGCPPYFREHS